MCADDGISFVSYLGGAVKYIKGNEYLKFHIVIIPFFFNRLKRTCKYIDSEILFNTYHPLSATCREVRRLIEKKNQFSIMTFLLCKYY